jgi:hypothetical protein
MPFDSTTNLAAQERMLLALTRLLKIQIRLFIYTRKSEQEPDMSWGALIKVEQDFLVGAEKEWSEVLNIWIDPIERVEWVNLLLGPACDEAREDVLERLRGSVQDVDLIAMEFRPGVRID